MRAYLALFLLVAPGALAADPVPPMPPDSPEASAAPSATTVAVVAPPLPASDQRTLRELQSHAYGRPSLPMDAPRQDSLLALAALGSQASEPGDDSLQGQDYASLLSLLQRYRDDLLKLGMDSEELQKQMEILQARVAELEDRLNKLKPRDGLKIYGRYYMAFDDLHVIGSGLIPETAESVGNASIGSMGKPLGQGVRSQFGAINSDLTLEGTRGLVTGYADIDVGSVFGTANGTGAIAYRRVMVELRFPITIEVGDFDDNLTPLTLWRNDTTDPFEPQIYQDRQQRMEDDLLLKPDKWMLTGLRATTKARLLNAVDLRLESITGIAGNPAAYLNPSTSDIIYTGLGSESNSGIPGAPTYATQLLAERYDTYFQGWKVEMPLLNDALTIGYNGMLFWDNPNSVPNMLGYLPMSELVQSLSLGYRSGRFSANAEAATSSYQNPWLISGAQGQEGPLTGTALTLDTAWKDKAGYVRLFGRMVSPDFHASGAQGRTEDYSYEFLGPFLTENSQLGIGVNGSLGLLESNASRLNNVLIPPGTVIIPSTETNGSPSNSISQAAVWQQLLPYGPGEEIDPYGAATPNREGGGLEGQWKFFNGVLVPLASAELFNEEADPLTYTSGVVLAPFKMTRYRVGTELNLEPCFGWPLRFGAGWTSTDSDNGQTASNGTAYNLSTQLIDLSAEWNSGKPVGLGLGYRHMTALGQDETFSAAVPTYQVWNVLGPNGETWDILGAGLWWRPNKNMTIDLVSTVAHTDGDAVQSMGTDENVLRMTVEF